MNLQGYCSSAAFTDRTSLTPQTVFLIVAYVTKPHSRSRKNKEEAEKIRRSSLFKTFFTSSTPVLNVFRLKMSLIFVKFLIADLATE